MWHTAHLLAVSSSEAPPTVEMHDGAEFIGGSAVVDLGTVKYRIFRRCIVNSGSGKRELQYGQRVRVPGNESGEYYFVVAALEQRPDDPEVRAVALLYIAGQIRVLRPDTPRPIGTEPQLCTPAVTAAIDEAMRQFEKEGPSQCPQGG